MQNYIALLRGINVSGQKKIKMADLRKLLTSAGLIDVQTYIQSGNIIFKTKLTNHNDMEGLIRKSILDHYGFDVPALVKTGSELQEAIAKNPFTKQAEENSKRIYLTFLSQKPDILLVDKILETDYSPEQWVLEGKTIYFYSPTDYGNAKMNNNFFEKKLKVSATTRNWRTTNILIEMIKNQ